MDIHLDARGEDLVKRQMRSGRFLSPEHVVLTALVALGEDAGSPVDRAASVQQLREFAAAHDFRLGPDLHVRDLLHHEHKY